MKQNYFSIKNFITDKNSNQINKVYCKSIIYFTINTKYKF